MMCKASNMKTQNLDWADMTGYLLRGDTYIQSSGSGIQVVQMVKLVQVSHGVMWFETQLWRWDLGPSALEDMG